MEPTLSEMIDRLFQAEDPETIGCVTDAINCWLRSTALLSQRENGKIVRSDTVRLFQFLHLTLSAAPSLQKTRPAVNEFAPKPRTVVLAEIEAAATRAVVEAERPPEFLQRARDADERQSAMLGPMRGR